MRQKNCTEIIHTSGDSNRQSHFVHYRNKGQIYHQLCRKVSGTPKGWVPGCSPIEHPKTEV
jgi:hypothetical protein